MAVTYDGVARVLEDMDDMEFLTAQLRERILAKIALITDVDQEVIIHSLFEEIDVDKSGFIENAEFRQLLAKLQLHYRCADMYLPVRFITCISLQRSPLQSLVQRSGPHWRRQNPGSRNRLFGVS